MLSLFVSPEIDFTLQVLKIDTIKKLSAVDDQIIRLRFQITTLGLRFLCKIGHDLSAF